MFGDWHLAMAGYDAGEGKILKGLQRSGARDYWELRSGGAFLHRETRDYVPYVLAAALISKDPARFGFDVVPDPPIAWETVRVAKPVDLSRVAQAAGVPLEELRGLNSELTTRFTPYGVGVLSPGAARQRDGPRRTAGLAAGCSRHRREAHRREEGRHAPESRVACGSHRGRAARLQRPPRKREAEKGTVLVVPARRPRKAPARPRPREPKPPPSRRARRARSARFPPSHRTSPSPPTWGRSRRPRAPRLLWPLPRRRWTSPPKDSWTSPARCPPRRASKIRRPTRRYPLPASPRNTGSTVATLAARTAWTRRTRFTSDSA